MRLFIKQILLLFVIAFALSLPGKAQAAPVCPADSSKFWCPTQDICVDSDYGDSFTVTGTISVTGTMASGTTITVNAAASSCSAVSCYYRTNSDTIYWPANTYNIPYLGCTGGTCDDTFTISASSNDTNCLNPGAQTVTAANGSSSAKNFTFTCYSPPPDDPTVTISASPANITSGNSSTITWNSANTTSCSVSPNGWTGTSGSQSTGSLTSNRTYTVTCTNAAGSSVSASTEVTVSAAPPIRYKCNATSCQRDDANGSYSASDCGGACTSSCTVEWTTRPFGYPSPSYTIRWWGSASSGNSWSNTGLKLDGVGQNYNTMVSGSQDGKLCSGITPCLNATINTGSAGNHTLVFSKDTNTTPVTCTPNGTYTIINRPAPTVSISASPNPINYGASSTITWNSINANSCAASGAWTGAKATYNDIGELKSNLTASKTYTITCTGDGGSNSASVAVNINAPTATITADSGTTTIPYNTGTTIRWSSASAANCTVKKDGVAWVNNTLSGYQATGALTANTVYSIDCSGASGTSNAIRSVTVTVGAAPPPTCSYTSPGTNQLTGCLWDGTNFNTSDGNAPLGASLSSPVPDAPATSQVLDANWMGSAPNAFVGADTFSGRWRGNLNFKAGTYTFYAGADDGIKLIIDGEAPPIIASWIDTSYSERSATKTFATSGTHLIELEYYENGGDARATLRWTYAAPMDFSLSNQGDKTVFKGETVSNIFTANWLSGISEAINWSVTQKPANVSNTLAPASCTPPVSDSCATTATFTPSTTTGGTVIAEGRTNNNVAKASTFNLTVWDLPSASTTASCLNSSTSYAVAWGGQTAPAGSFADISTDSTFATYFHKDISGTTSTTAPSGFTYYNSAQLLTLNPSTTYYVRLYINGVNNTTLRSFTTPAACIIPMDFSLSNQGDKTVFTGETVSNIFTANWLSGISEVVLLDFTAYPANVSPSRNPDRCTPPVSGSCTTTATFTPSTTTGGTVTVRGNTDNAVVKSSSFNLNVFGQPSVTGTPVCLAPAANPYTISWGTATPTPPTPATVDTTGIVGQGSSVAIDPVSGFPVISYLKPGNSVRMIRCLSADCSSRNPEVNIASDDSFQGETSIAVDTAGIPIIGYVINRGSSGSLTIVKCGNANCSSGNTRKDVFSTTTEPGPNFVSIAIGTNGNPVVAYSRTSSVTRLILCGDPSCSLGNNDIPVGAGNDRPPIKVVIGTDGFPVVAFVNAAGGTLHVFRCGNAACTSGNTSETLDNNSTTNGGSTGGMAIGSDDKPIISHYDNNTLDLVVTHCGNASCSSGNTKTKVDTTGDVGSYSSIAKGADGLAIIAFYDATATNKDLRIFHCSNINCTTGTATSIDTTGDVGSMPSITISNGLPFISYYDATNGDMKVIKCSTAACDISRSWADISTGSSPTITPVNSAGSGGTYTSSVIYPATGYPIISYIKPGASLQVVKCNNIYCSSFDPPNIVASGNIQSGSPAKIALAGSLPVVVYLDDPTALHLVRCGDLACSSVTSNNIIKSGIGSIYYYTMAIAGGNPVVAYGNNNGTGFIKCNDAACSTRSETTNIPAFNGLISMTIGSDTFPIISSSQGGDLSVIHCGDATCSLPLRNTATNIDSSANEIGVSSIAIAGGVPVISYYDSTNGDLKFIRCGNTACSSNNTHATVDLTGNVGNYSSVAIGTDGLPFISYYDATAGNLDLKVAKCSDNACSSSAKTYVDTTGNVGQYTSVAIGADNLPFVSYYDATNTAMKVIKCSTAACDGAPSWVNNYYHKDISGLSSTAAPGGFGYFDGSQPDLTLSPNTPYYVRLYINGINNTTPVSFTTPTFTCVTATCSVSPSSINPGGSVTWSASPNGGGPSYTYLWSGSISGETSRTVTKTYSSPGTYSASVTVSDGVSSTPLTACSNTVFVNTPAFIKVEGDVHSQTGINAN